jgi:FCP1-like phosphatase family protein
MDLKSPITGVLDFNQSLVGKNKAVKTKRRAVKSGEVIFRISSTSEPNTIHEVTAPASGDITFTETLVQGQEIEKNFVLGTFTACTHPAIFAGMCVGCGEPPAPSSGSDFTASLTVGNGGTLKMSEAEAQKNASLKSSGLRKARKLALILDLDLTLIHCIMVPGGTPAQENCFDFSLQDDLSNGLSSPFSRQLFRVKLRPGVEEFLKNASSQYRLFVYTHGTRPYAEKVTSLLDPTGSLVSRRIVSRSDTEDIGLVKSLSRIIGESPDMAVILDDNAEVWRGDGEKHLLCVKPFKYFSSKEISANMLPSTVLPDGDERDEARGSAAARIAAAAAKDTQLAICTKLLQTIHSRFYDDNVESVANILTELKETVLKDCVITFLDGASRDYSLHTQAIADRRLPDRFLQANVYYKRLASSLGAQIDDALCPSTTHILLIGTILYKGDISILPGVKVVHCDWLKHSLWNLERASENYFLPKGINVIVNEDTVFEAMEERSKELKSAEETRAAIKAEREAEEAMIHQKLKQEQDLVDRLSDGRSSKRARIQENVSRVSDSSSDDDDEDWLNEMEAQLEQGGGGEEEEDEES